MYNTTSEEMLKTKNRNKNKILIIINVLLDTYYYIQFKRHIVQVSAMDTALRAMSMVNQYTYGRTARTRTTQKHRINVSVTLLW